MFSWMQVFPRFSSLLAHASLISLYAIALGFMFFLIAALDNPYRGEVHVGTEPFEALQKAFSKWEKRRPC